MNMPGFTAESSLYPRSARYHARAMLAGLRQEGEIVPSMRSKCTWDEDDYCCTYDDWNGTGACCSTPSKPYLGIDCVFTPKVYV